MGAKDSIFRFADREGMLFMLFGTLGSIGDGLQNPLMMLILDDVINDYGSGKALTNDVVNKALKLLYAAIGVGFSAFMEGQCWTRTTERQTSRMRMEYLKSVLRKDVGFFDTQTAGTSTTNQVVTLISSDANSIQVALCEKIPDCLAYMSTFVFCHISAFILSWRLTLAAIPLSITFIVPGLVFGKIMIGLIMKMIQSYGVAGGIAEQAISSIRTVYSYVGEKETLDRFSRALQTTLEYGIKQGLLKGILLGSMGMIYIGWGFQAWVGTYLVTQKHEKGGHVFIAGFNVLMGGFSVLSALPYLTGITEATTAASWIFEIIDRVPTIDSEDKKGKALSFVRGEIEFKDVYFCYPSRPDTPILEDFNLKVRAGQTVGLVGGSGSGKSTVIALLERFYDPIEGKILLDGYKIRRLQLKWLGSQLGLVNQEPVLFATTIKENILFGKEGATIDNFITKLPDGYETQVGQFGFQMSGGQKQRIAIARALLKDPKILLLDEATSATTIIIAHRLSTIRTANLIVVLQAGRVVESGSHNELMSMNDGEGGEYSKMVQLQQVAMQNEASTTPMSVRSSIHSTPMLNPFSQACSMGTPYSISMPYDPDDDDDDKYLKKSTYPHASQAMLGCLGALGSGAVQPINAYCVGSLISVYFLKDEPEIKSKSRVLSLIFLGIGIFNFITNVLQHYNYSIMGERLTKRVRKNLLEKLMTFERLATEANMVRSLVGNWMSLLVQAIFGASFAYTLGLPIVIGSFYARTVLMRSMAEKARKGQKEGSQLASEAVINHRTTTSFSSQKRILKESIKQSWISGFGLFSAQFFNTASSALAFWYGGRLLQQNLIEPKHLFQAFLILLFTAYIIAEAGSMTNDLSKGSSAIQSVLAILDRKSEIDPDNKWGLDIKRRIKGRVELKNVFFAYPSRPDQMIFKGLSLKIDAGQTVALAGPSGSGKSTIIGLIERFYDPDKGSIYIDEQEIKNYNLRILRSHIALVSQEPTLFAGTISENISYGKEDATESEIRRAAVHANAHEFISGMKDGYNTYCGERGAQLLGGQKQRIALARAILKNPSILLLDEATSALDKMMVGRTCVVVAHQLSTIQKADSISVVKNGKVVEQGSHNDLVSLGRGGEYYSLIKQQGGSSSKQ
ncbi:hypothetical protein ACJW31_06G044500 [Castanea mollissima]